MSSEREVIVAGAGPVGVVAALALAREGIPVKLFEAAAEVSDAPRASTLHPATLEMLHELDLLDEVINRGLVARTFQYWDRPTRTLIAEFDHAVLADVTPFPFVVQCEQHKLARLGIERLRSFPHAEVVFSTPIVAIQPQQDCVQVTFNTADGQKTTKGSYLIGADGGRSTVRKALGIEFEGYTFPEQFLVLTTSFDFASAEGIAYRAYFSDPDEWVNLFKVAGDDGLGRWRAVFPGLPGQTEDEILDPAANEARLQKFFPRKGAYEILHRNVYRVHQRVAASFREGWVFLAGDSAHVNNPIGGLGLNCGVHDAMQLVPTLAAVIRGERPQSDLDHYDAVRRPTNQAYVQQQTIANKKRLEEKDHAAREANFDALRKSASDPASQHAFLMRTSLLESVRKPNPLRIRPA